MKYINAEMQKSYLGKADTERCQSNCYIFSRFTERAVFWAPKRFLHIVSILQMKKLRWNNIINVITKIITISNNQMIRSTGSGISHCPNSNFSLKSGVCNVQRLRRAGVKVCSELLLGNLMIETFAFTRLP